MAQWHLEEGRPDLAEPLALQAAAAFRQQRSEHREAMAESVLALARATQKKFREAQTAVDRASTLLPKVQVKQLRLSAGANLERAKTLMGKAAETMKPLEALLSEAIQIGLIPQQFDIRLALGDAEIQSGEIAKGRARLAALRSEATGQGFKLIARRADLRITSQAR